jgi:ABC-2 type transport system permease protein
MNPASKYLVLLRRELWESPSLWRVPVVGAAIVAMGALLGTLHLGDGVSVTVDPGASAAMVRATGAQMMMGITAFISAFAAAAVAIYLLDSLYGERKDRSILFWKSLPVSDAQAVLSKLIVALVIVPLVVVVLATLLLPVITGLGALLVPAVRPQVGGLVTGGLLALFRLVGAGTIVVLWYAPVAAYLMLASVAARHPPLVYAALPPLGLALGEQLLFGSRHVLDFFVVRLFPIPPFAPSDFNATDGRLSLGTEWWRMFAEPGLWLGVLVAAATLYLVIRLRRYRDDT